MSGFRASLKGSFPFHGIRGDLSTYGKVIGGGLPLAAFGGRADIMELLSPMGGVYQAGTLSGNPLAVAAGLATLKAIEESGFYERLEGLALKFAKGFESLASKHGFALQTAVRGSMVGFFFSKAPVCNWDDAKAADSRIYASFHAAMLERGVYFAPSQFETSFISSAFDEALIDMVLEKIDSALREVGARI